MEAAEVVALAPAPGELVLERLAVEGGRLVVIAAARRAAVPCPACGSETGRVHSRYERRLTDLPWHGLAVALRVRVRRFVCEGPRCPRRICCERLPETAVPYARRTVRLDRALELIGLALGGETGVWLAHALGMATSPDTVLRALVAGPPNDALIPPVREHAAWTLAQLGSHAATYPGERLAAEDAPGAPHEARARSTCEPHPGGTPDR